jgi:hypothetical protein
MLLGEQLLPFLAFAQYFLIKERSSRKLIESCLKKSIKAQKHPIINCKGDCVLLGFLPIAEGQETPAPFEPLDALKAIQACSALSIRKPSFMLSSAAKRHFALLSVFGADVGSCAALANGTKTPELYDRQKKSHLEQAPNFAVGQVNLGSASHL